MKTYDLSICIPSRNEQFISNTVQNILNNKRGKTEVLVGLDGEWPETPIPDHPDVRIIYVSEPIGQRAMQNKLARLSKAKYVAKTDAHVAFSEGFDVELLRTFEELGDDITVSPLMKNLHAFDWKCKKCGNRWYQGPNPTQCHLNEKDLNPDCDGQEFVQRIVFKPRNRTPNSTSYLFNSKLQFWYFGEYEKYQEGDLVESMSLQGSFFAATRKRYFELPLCDDSWGSWGNQGSEVAIKTWLSGGQVIINKRCWYAHLFRTQSGFGFPYQQSGKGQERARQISRDLFLNNKWNKQVRPLSWILDKFWTALQDEKSDKYVDRWTNTDLNRLKLTEGRFSKLSPLSSKIDTDSASSESVIVWDRKKVSPLAVSFSGVISPATTKDIFSLSNKLEMVGVAAGSILAYSVVDNLVVGKGANQPSINDSMNQHGNTRDVLNGDAPIPVNVSMTSPNPASLLNDNSVYQDTNGMRSKVNSKAFRPDGHGNIISYGALFFTDNQLPIKLAKWCKRKLVEAVGDMPISCVSLKPTDFGDIRIAMNLKRSYLTMFTQILAGLEALNTDVVFFCEHDVGYPPEHFDFTPTEHKFYYDVSWVKVHSDGLCVSWKAEQVSGLCAYRDDLIEYYKWRVETFDKDNFDRKFEPFSGEKSVQWQSPVPYIDVRGDGRNLTYNKRSLDDFRNKDTAVDFAQIQLEDIPGWTLALSDLY